MQGTAATYTLEEPEEDPDIPETPDTPTIPTDEQSCIAAGGTWDATKTPACTLPSTQ